MLGVESTFVSVSKKQTALAEKVLSNLRAAGVDEYAIFGSLVSHFRRLYYSLSTTAAQEVVASCLKCSPFAVMFARRDNRHLTRQIADIYKQILNLEYKIKSGQLTASSAITIMMLEMSNIA